MKTPSCVVLDSPPVSCSMRSRPLDALFPKTRHTLLATMLLDVGQEWYLTDLARHLEIQPSSLQRELAGLVKAGILMSRKDGNRIYYRTNRDCPFHEELRGLFRKAVGLKQVLRSSFKGLEGRIEVAFVYGPSAAGMGGRPTRDIDVMVIGRAGLADLTPGLKRVEQELGRAVNPSTYTGEEVAKKLAAGHHFLRTVMDGEKFFIRGDEAHLAALGTGPDKPALISSCPDEHLATPMDL